MSRNAYYPPTVQKKAAANDPKKFILFDFFSELLNFVSSDKRLSFPENHVIMRRNIPVVVSF